MPLNRKRVNGLPKAARLQARATVATASGFGVLWELRHDREAAEPATSFGRIRRQTPCFAPFPTALLVARLRSQSLPGTLRTLLLESARRQSDFSAVVVSADVRFPPKRAAEAATTQSGGTRAALFDRLLARAPRQACRWGAAGGLLSQMAKSPRGQGLFCLPCRLSAAARQKCTPGCQVAKFSDLGPCARPRGSPSASSA